MGDFRKVDDSSTKAMALNVTAWHDLSVASLGFRTFRNEVLWWRKPGGSPIYLSAIVTDPEAADDVLHSQLRRVETSWGTEKVSLWDCWALRDLSRMGFKRKGVEPWYLRHPSPLSRNLRLPDGLSIETVTNPVELAEFEAASWDGFEMTETAREVGRFGQHALGTLGDGGMHYVVARLNGRVVASTIAYATADMLGIYGISTRPEFRRRGYATALVRAAVSLRPDLPVSVQPSPESACIYTDAGFVPAGQVAAWRNGI